MPVLNLGLVYCYSCWLKARIKLVRAPEGEFLALAFLSSQDWKKHGSVSTSSHSLLRIARGKKLQPGICSVLEGQRWAEPQCCEVGSLRTLHVAAGAAAKVSSSSARNIFPTCQVYIFLMIHKLLFSRNRWGGGKTRERGKKWISLNVETNLRSPPTWI